MKSIYNYITESEEKTVCDIYNLKGFFWYDFRWVNNGSNDDITDEDFFYKKLKELDFNFGEIEDYPNVDMSKILNKGADFITIKQTETTLLKELIENDTKFKETFAGHGWPVLFERNINLNKEITDESGIHFGDLTPTEWNK
jgi:hypothetical protein